MFPAHFPSFRHALLILLMVTPLALSACVDGAKTLDSGTWNVPTRFMYRYSFSAKDDTKLRLKLTPTSPSPNATVYVLPFGEDVKLRVTGTNGVKSLLTHRLTGDATLETSLSAGMYHILIQNDGSSSLDLKFEIAEVR